MHFSVQAYAEVLQKFVQKSCIFYNTGNREFLYFKKTLKCRKFKKRAQEPIVSAGTIVYGLVFHKF